MIRKLLLIPLSITLTHCATMRDSALLGLGVGATLGAGAGALAGYPSGYELAGGAIGAASGAAFGALMGYLAHKENEQGASQNAKPVEEGPPPSLTKPVVRRVWVPDRVEDDKLVRGHFIYVIEKKSGWTKTDDSE